jgi:hypothetical protein
MSRHVAFIEAHGARTPERERRQRTIIEAVCREYRPLPEKLPHCDRPIESFGFSTRTTAAEAMQRLVTILDSVDADWREYVRAWDGFGREDRSPLRDPPQTGLLGFVQRLFNW